MQEQKTISELAQRYGVSTDAVTTLWKAIIRGSGRQAQFSHPELGGSGQWMRGGMLMISDMFNHDLKAKVAALCTDLSDFLATHPAPATDAAVSATFPPMAASQSWPSELGTPSASGSQNDLRYAFFPATRRLAIAAGERVTVYDTGDHQINGVSQQQSHGSSLTFTSQNGLVRLSDLPVVNTQGSGALPVPPKAPTSNTEEITDAIARLAKLRQKDILTEEEFTAKKTELLNRL